MLWRLGSGSEALQWRRNKMSPCAFKWADFGCRLTDLLVEPTSTEGREAGQFAR